jgi:hypothetical protein
MAIRTAAALALRKKFPTAVNFSSAAERLWGAA